MRTRTFDGWAMAVPYQAAEQDAERDTGARRRQAARHGGLPAHYTARLTWPQAEGPQHGEVVAPTADAEHEGVGCCRRSEERHEHGD